MGPRFPWQIGFADSLGYEPIAESDRTATRRQELEGARKSTGVFGLAAYRLGLARKVLWLPPLRIRILGPASS